VPVPGFFHLLLDLFGGRRGIRLEVLLQPTHGAKERMWVRAAAATAQHFGTDARHAAPQKIPVVLGEDLRDAQPTDVAFALAHQRLIDIRRVLLEKQPCSRRPDKIHAPETAMNGFPAALPGLRWVPNTHDRAAVLLCNRFQGIHEWARFIGAVHIDFPNVGLDGVNHDEAGSILLEGGF
jgi:hypothetical protein